MKQEKKIKRERRIILRLTDAEYSTLIQIENKTSLNRSEFIRRLIFNRIEEIPDAKNLTLLSNMYKELRKYGSNFNQISKAVNSISGNTTKFNLTKEKLDTIETLSNLFENFKIVMNDFVRFSHHQIRK